jgi:hypothetical protein
MPGSTDPVPEFDPLDLANVGSEVTLNWFRAAELKNGRTAMLGSVGYLTNVAGIHFPGMLSAKEGIAFSDLASMKPIDAWDAVPFAGKIQILFACLITEIITESKEVHYTKGGQLPTIVFPPIDMSSIDAATLRRRRDSELNNGRLAMIGIMSFFAHAYIPGSVPVLPAIAAFN